MWQGNEKSFMLSNYHGKDNTVMSIRKDKPKKAYKEITETPEQAFIVERVIDWSLRIEGYS